ncbi:MAG: four helix bundle protein [bacterium]|nr:four helix bundle protein [bacterium]
MNKGETIKSFTDLNAWREGHKLVLLIYKITKNFPKEEMFGLINQLRRAAVSVTSNIAEGFSRQSYKEKIKFYCTSLGSTTEVQNQILIAKDVKYINSGEFIEIADQTIVVHKLLNGLIKSSRNHNS